MQSKEKDYSLAIGAMIAYAVAMAVIAFIGVVVIVLTIVCICAWNKPVRFRGEIITPDEARAFIMFGIFGAFVGLAIANHWGTGNARQYFPIIGYVVGSMGFAAHCHLQSKIEPVSEAEVLPPINVTPREEAPSEKRPFEFASWDDEKMH